MGDDQPLSRSPPVVCDERTGGGDVEVEDALGPTAAAATAEIVLDSLEHRQHIGDCDIGLDRDHCIGEGSLARSDGIGRANRRPSDDS